MSTKRFLLQKILQLFLTLFLVTAITFILMQLSPIDAAEAYSRRIFTVDETRIEAVREQMGLNRPIVVQYLDWLNDLLHFDLGNSYVDNRDVFLIVGSALKETACIVLLSAVLQAVGALILGGSALSDTKECDRQNPGICVHRGNIHPSVLFGNFIY